MKFEIAHWRLPSQARAFDGWIEGSPTPEQRATILAEVARERETWTPGQEAWNQLCDLGRFIGQRVRLQFWDRIMLLLEEEGPYPMLADCRGIIVLQHEGYLQAYLVVDHTEQLPNASGYSPAKFLSTEMISGLSLAPIAELLEICSIS
jgi:hypothetical protein